MKKIIAQLSLVIIIISLGFFVPSDVSAYPAGWEDVKIQAVCLCGYYNTGQYASSVTGIIAEIFDFDNKEPGNFTVKQQSVNITSLNAFNEFVKSCPTPQDYALAAIQCSWRLNDGEADRKYLSKTSGDMISVFNGTVSEVVKAKNYTADGNACESVNPTKPCGDDSFCDTTKTPSVCTHKLYNGARCDAYKDIGFNVCISKNECGEDGYCRTPELARLSGVKTSTAPTEFSGDQGSGAINIIKPEIKIPLGDLSSLTDAYIGKCEKNPLQENAECIKVPWIAQYIGAAYKYGLTLGSILAVMMLMLGGITYMLGGINPQMVSKGKELMIYSVFGIIIILGSYVLLNTVNPNLINLNIVEVEIIQRQELADFGEASCETIDTKIFEIEGYDKSTAKCGKKYKVKAKQTKKGTRTTSIQDSCVSKICEGSKACIEDEKGNFTCTEALFHGNIYYEGNRYVTSVWLVCLQHGDDDRIGDEIDIGEGKKYYTIPKTADRVEEMRKCGVVGIEVEINDTGMETANMVAEVFLGPGASGADSLGAKIISKITPTQDDNYVMGGTKAYMSGKAHYTRGVWIDMCENNIVGSAYPCKISAESKGGPCTEAEMQANFATSQAGTGGGWKLGYGAFGWLAGHILTQNGIQVDIDTRMFWEDHDDYICDVMNRGQGFIPAFPEVEGYPCMKVANYEAQKKNPYKLGAFGLKCLRAGTKPGVFEDGTELYVWSDGSEGALCNNSKFNLFQCKKGLQCAYLTPGDASKCKDLYVPTPPDSTTDPRLPTVSLGATQGCYGYCWSGEYTQPGSGPQLNMSCGDEGCGIDKQGRSMVCFQKTGQVAGVDVSEDTGKCQYGGWADPCQTDKHCNAKEGFYCNKKANTCSKKNAKRFQNCDPDQKGACASPLICTQPYYAPKGEKVSYSGETPNEFTAKFGGGLTNNTYICMEAGLKVLNCDEKNVNTACYNKDHFFCNTEDLDYCTKIISGAKCDIGEGAFNEQKYQQAGYKCWEETKFLYKDGDYFAD